MPLRADHLAEVDDLLLGVGDVADDVLGAALEDLVLERVELVADLAQHREAVVEGVVDDPVEQVARAAGEQLVAQLLLLAAALEQVLDRLQRLVRDRDQEVAADEDVELAGVQAPDLAVEDREVQDDEQVVGVLVDLRPLVAREDVLEVEGVEVELLLQPGALERRRALDVDPAQAGALDRLDLGLALARLSRRGEIAPRWRRSLGLGRLGIVARLARWSRSSRPRATGYATAQVDRRKACRRSLAMVAAT